MTEKYDIIVLGGGPNGLETAAYLSKAGLKVCVLERRFEVGGGLATEEVTIPDFYHNTHANYMMMVDYAPLYQDFALEEKYQCEHILPSLVVALPLSDGRSIGIYSDLEKTCESIAKFSQRDADGYRELYHLAAKCVDRFIAPATFAPPIPVLDQVVALQTTDLGKTILEYSEKTPLEIIDEFFENEHVKALMLFLACHWGVRYDMTGLGYLVLLYINRASSYRLSRGGSHRVAQALNKIVFENGGLVLNNRRVRRIILDNGKATGVEFKDGSRMEAERAVLSSLDPSQTFLQLVGRDNLQGEFVKKIEGWQWEKYSLLGLHLAMEEPPKFRAAEADPEMNQALMYVLGYETPDELMADWDAVERGELRENTNVYACFPSIHDASMAPAGRCVAYINQMVPYELKEGADKWLDYGFRRAHGDKCIAKLEKYAPNITKDKIMERFISTPYDVEHKFADMVKGSYKQGAYTVFQMGYLRPNEECSTTRTPVGNLYLCGSSCYPGGCVIWGPGYLAANAVAEDLGLSRWWEEPEIVTRAKREGLL
jgi:phytoene dehydrogenase-like protein